MNGCIFCRIIRDEIPSTKVYENDRVLAFDDINPLAPVHVVIIPKEHIATLLDVKIGQQDYINAMMTAVPQIAKLKGIDQSGFRIVINCNKDGGQIVFHLHMHLLGGKKLGHGLA